MLRCSHNVLLYQFTVQHHTNYKSRILQNILCLLHSLSYSDQGCLTHQWSKKGCFHVNTICGSAQHQIHFPHQPTFKKKLQPPLAELCHLKDGCITQHLSSAGDNTPVLLRAAPEVALSSGNMSKQTHPGLRTEPLMLQACSTCINGLH